MKDYLKSYIDSLDNDTTIVETKTNVLDVDIPRKKRDVVRIKETDIISESKAPKMDRTPIPPVVIITEKHEKRKKKKAIKDSPEWDIYKERVFIKTLLHQRFNYFVIVYALTVLSAAMVPVKISQAVILITGFFILSMLWFNLVRIHIEYQEIYTLFHKTVNSNIVLSIIEKKAQMRQSFFSKLPMNSALTYGIPVLCLVSILCYIAILLILE